MTASGPRVSLPNPPDIRRLLIVRLGSMGDILHTLPAAFGLRAALPEAIIGWIVEEQWADLLCATSEPRSGPRSPRRPLADKIHLVNTKRWRKNLFSTETWERVAAAISDLRAPQYEVAVDFQGAVRSAILARWSGASTIYGFRQPRENVASMFYTRQVLASGNHIAEQNLSLAEDVVEESLGMPSILLPCNEAAERHCTTWLQDHAVDQFVLLNPGAGWGAKQWPAERYGQVAQELAKSGFQALINYGPNEEELARAVESSSGGTATPVCWPLADLIALTRRASLFIGGDTGPLHLAAALGIPVVALFGPTNPARNGPFGTCSIVLRDPSSQNSHQRRSRTDPGLMKIQVRDVLAAAQQFLGRSGD